MAEIIKFPIPKNSSKGLWNELCNIMAPLEPVDITQQFKQMKDYYPKVWHTCKAGGVTTSQWQNPGRCPFCGEKI